MWLSEAFVHYRCVARTVWRRRILCVSKPSTRSCWPEAPATSECQAKYTSLQQMMETKPFRPQACFPVFFLNFNFRGTFTMTKCDFRKHLENKFTPTSFANYDIVVQHYYVRLTFPVFLVYKAYCCFGSIEHIFLLPMNNRNTFTGISIYVPRESFWPYWIRMWVGDRSEPGSRIELWAQCLP